MIKLTIIVPVFNAEDYLEECIKSICNQKLKDIEVLLINDGSTDGSEEICKKIAKVDKRFKYYYQENKGPSIARNYGISKAQGEYIGFCDADDRVYDDMYQLMYDKAKTKNIDIVMCDIFSERNNEKFGFPWEKDILFEGEEIMNKLIPHFIGNQSDTDSTTPLWGSVVRCIYSKQLIIKNNICFDETIDFAEDLVFTLHAMTKSNKIFIIDKVLYFYRMNASSLMNSHTKYRVNMWEKRVYLVDILQGLLKATSTYEINKARLENTMRCYFHECIGNIFRNKDGNFKEMMVALKEILYNPLVIDVFSKHDACNKKKIIYDLIKYRCSIIIYLYYKVRLK